MTDLAESILIKLAIALFIGVPFLVFSIKQFRKKGFFSCRPTDAEIGESRALAERLRQEGKSEKEVERAIIRASIKGDLAAKEKPDD